MPPQAGCYLFLLGMAAGAALLPMSAFRRVSPVWLRWLLLASGAFVISRYAAMAVFATAAQPEPVWGWRFCWFATSLAFPLQTAFALDQLVRHPGMTPRGVLLRISPWLAVYLLVILFGPAEAVADRVVGWSVRLAPGWARLLAAAHALFVLTVVWLAAGLARRIPAWPTRLALAGLAAAYLALAADGVLLGLGHWYFRPYLFTELLAMAAIWHAYETAARSAF